MTQVIRSLHFYSLLSFVPNLKSYSWLLWKFHSKVSKKAFDLDLSADGPSPSGFPGLSQGRPKDSAPPQPLRLLSEVAPPQPPLSQPCHNWPAGTVLLSLHHSFRTRLPSSCLQTRSVEAHLRRFYHRGSSLLWSCAYPLHMLPRFLTFLAPDSLPLRLKYPCLTPLAIWMFM